MTEKIPVVSIIMATFNRAHLILETIESIRNQTFTDFECLIIDDGSKDNTEYILNEITQSDPRFIYHKRPKSYRKGLPGCRNYGLDLCRGEFIIFFDDDDIMHYQNLEISVSSIQGSSYGFCRFGRKVFFGSFNQKMNNQQQIIDCELGIEQFDKIMSNKIPFNSCQILWQKACFRDIKFDERLMYAEEWECYLKIIHSGYRGLNISNTLMYARKHGKSNTGEYFEGKEIRLRSHSLAINSIFEYLMKCQSHSKFTKKYLINEYFKINGRHKTIINFMPKFNQLDRIFWQFYLVVFPARLKLYKLKKYISAN